MIHKDIGNRAHLEVPRDKTPAKPLAVPLAALDGDVESLEVLFKLFPYRHCSRQCLVIDPMVTAPLLVFDAIPDKGVVCVQQGEVVL